MNEDLFSTLLEEYYKLMPNYKKVLNTIPFFEEKKLSIMQHFVINILMRQYPLTLNELANIANTSKQQMSKLVDSLNKIGLVDRKMNENNHREIQLSLSEKGILFVNEVLKMQYESLKEKLKYYSDEDIINIIEHLKAINTILSGDA